VLQEQLAIYKAAQQGRGRTSDGSSSNKEDDTNPFHNSSFSDDLTKRRARMNTRAYQAKDLGVKVDILEFEGRLQPNDFIYWLCTVERVLELKDVPDDKLVKLVAIKLKKHASIWWENLKRQREREGRNKIKTWDKMRRELTRKFLLEYYSQEVFIEFHNSKQNSLTIEEYTMEFEELLMKCNIQEPEEQTVARYLGRLSEEIANVVQLQPFWTLNDVIRLALKVKKQMIQRKNNCFPKDRNVSNSSKQRWVTPQNNEDHGSSSSSKSSKRCFKC